MNTIEKLVNDLDSRLDKIELGLMLLEKEIDRVKQRLDVDIAMMERDISALRGDFGEISMKSNPIHYRDF